MYYSNMHVLVALVYTTPSILELLLTIILSILNTREAINILEPPVCRLFLNNERDADDCCVVQ